MERGPRKRLISRMLSACLSRMRLYGELPEEAFAGHVRDLPELLRQTADQLECPPPDLAGHPEPTGFEGYDHWAETYDFEPDNFVIAGEEEVIWDMIGDAVGLHVLDVGCGTGRHAVPLARAGAHVIGYEPSPEMLTRARIKAQGFDVELHQGSIGDLRSAPGGFDLVLCCLVLSHVEDIASAIARLVAHMRPGGRLIVSDFHPFCLLVGWRTSCVTSQGKFVVPNYVHLPSEYMGAMQVAGLRVTRFAEPGRDAGTPGMPMTLVMEAASCP